MKTKLKIGTLGAFACLITSVSSFAQSNSGNGDGIYYLNGVPQIADPFVKPAYAEGEMKLSPEMVHLLTGIQALLQKRNFEMDSFFKRRVFSSVNEYYYSKKLPCLGMKGLVSLDGKPIVDDACTLNGITYVLKEPFASQSFTDQALTLIHERLHAEYPNAEHHWITGFITGLRFALALKEEQVSNHFRSITPDEKELLKNMYVNAKRMGIPLGDFFDIMEEGKIQIAEYGGGLLWYGGPDTTLKDKIFVGVDSVTHAYPVGSSNSILINSSVFDPILLKNATILNSKLTASSIEDSEVSGTTFNYVIAVNTKLENSQVEFAKINHSEISDSIFKIGSNIITYWSDTGVGYENRVTDSKISNSVFVDSQIDASEVNHSSFWNATFSKAKVKLCDFKGTYIKTIIDGGSCEETRFIQGTYLPKKNKVVIEAGAALKNSEIITNRCSDGSSLVALTLTLKANTQVSNLHLRTDWWDDFGVAKTLIFQSPDAPLAFNPDDLYLFQVQTKNLVFRTPYHLLIHTVEEMNPLKLSGPEVEKVKQASFE